MNVEAERARLQVLSAFGGIAFERSLLSHVDMKKVLVQNLYERPRKPARLCRCERSKSIVVIV